MKKDRFSPAPDYAVIANLARQLRRDSLRMIHHAGAGHIGGALGLADIMAVLYRYAMDFDSAEPQKAGRDRLVLSNGHTCAVWYSALARSDYMDPGELADFRRLGSRLQGHPARRYWPEVIETSSGPLGQGFSVANGIALSQKLAGSRACVYCIVGDGELQEGQVWEATLTASHYALDNLVLIVSANGLQIDGAVADVISLAPIADKFRSFGWFAREIDGHDLPSIVAGLDAAAEQRGRPAVLVAETVMGKGVSFMENKALWHGTWPNEDQTRQGLEEIGSAAGFEDFPLNRREASHV
jgi:transketolase